MRATARWVAVACLTALASLAVKAQEPAPVPQPSTVAISIEPSGRSLTVIYFNRPVVVLRASIMGRGPEDRRALAIRMMDDLVASDRTGPVTAVATTGGFLIGVDGRVITGLAEADLDAVAGEDLQTAAREAAARMQLAMTEASEARRPGVWLRGGALSLGAIAVSALILWLLGRTRRATVARLSALAEKAVARSGLADQYSVRASGVLNFFQRRLVTVVTIGLQLGVFYSLLTFVLRRFPYTRPWGETLRESLFAVVSGLGLGILHAIPSLFTVLVILVIARVVTLLIEPWFAAVERGGITVSWVHAETAATTHRLVTIAVWLFAAAMAFPYVPGSDTDAFRGISVALGLMVTLGSSGLVNQVMSGLVVTYSRALRLGDFVRIGDVEGTITDVGLLSTKLRTLKSEEITIPNAVVVTQTTTDYSRYPEDVLTAASITVGYNVPWRQVHALLLLAADRTEGVRRAPKPRVVQLALEDMRVNYTLIFCLEQQESRNLTLSALHAHILDLFNEYGVQIVTPNYEADPPEPKVVPKAGWFAAPARPESTED